MPIAKRRVIYLHSSPFLLLDFEYHRGVGSANRIHFCRCPVLAVVHYGNINDDFVDSALTFYIPFVF